MMKFLKLEGLLESVKGYIDTRMQIVKLEFHEKTANAITSLLFIFLAGFMGLMMMLFVSLALGYYLNYLLNSNYLGFAIMALFFLIMVVIFAVNINKGMLHRKIHNLATDLLVKKKENQKLKA